MKKIILVLTAIAISAGAYAQSDSTHRTNPQESNYNQHRNMQNNRADKVHPDGVMMQDGKIMKVENGQLTALDQDMTLNNGTRIMTDGNYTDKDGRTMMLKEGQHMDREGNLTFLKSDKDNDMYLVPDSTRKKDNQRFSTPPQFNI